jgi:hypothetical protein
VCAASSQENLPQRKQVGNMLREWDKKSFKAN